MQNIGGCVCIMSPCDCASHGGGDVFGGAVSCPAVVRTCPDGSTRGYKPGGCEFEACDQPTGGGGLILLVLIALAVWAWK